MLGKLVNKFKKQSLQDQQQQCGANFLDSDNNTSTTFSTASSSTSLPLETNKSAKPGAPYHYQNNKLKQEEQSPTTLERKRLTRKGSQLNQEMNKNNPSVQCQTKILRKSVSDSKEISVIFDSGTESDDDELERLDSMSNASALSAQNSFNNSGNTSKTVKICISKDVNEIDVIGTSPPTLTSLPPLISEIDTSSWDSMGCESGIVLRESAERDDCSCNIDLLENSIDSFSASSKNFESDDVNEDIALTPVHSKDGFPTNFGAAMTKENENLPLKMSTTLQQSSVQNNVTLRGPIDFSALRDHNSDNGMKILEKSKKVDCTYCTDDEKGGAFKPVIKYRNRHNSVSGSTFEKSLSVVVDFSSSLQSFPAAATLSVAQQSSRTNTPSPNNLIGEKRRWGTTHAATENTNDTLNAPFSPIASRTRGSLMAATNQTKNTNVVPENQQEISRAVLTARRTRVRVIYHDLQQKQQPQNSYQRHRLSLQVNSLKQSDADILGAGGESPPSAPSLANKRGRLTTQPIIKANNGERPSLNFDKMRERMMGFAIPSTLNN